MVIFNSLGKDEIHRIIDIALRDLYKRLDTMDFELELSDDAKEFVAEKGFDPQFGARPLHRAIQKYIEDPLAEFILNNKPEEGQTFRAELNEEDPENPKIVISVMEKVDTDVESE